MPHDGLRWQSQQLSSHALLPAGAPDFLGSLRSDAPGMPLPVAPPLSASVKNSAMRASQYALPEGSLR